MVAAIDEVLRPDPFSESRVDATLNYELASGIEGATTSSCDVPPVPAPAPAPAPVPPAHELASGSGGAGSSSDVPPAPAVPAAPARRNAKPLWRDFADAWPIAVWESTIALELAKKVCASSLTETDLSMCLFFVSVQCVFRFGRPELRFYSFLVAWSGHSNCNRFRVGGCACLGLAQRAS